MNDNSSFDGEDITINTAGLAGARQFVSDRLTSYSLSTAVTSNTATFNSDILINGSRVVTENELGEIKSQINALLSMVSDLTTKNRELQAQVADYRYRQENMARDVDALRYGSGPMMDMIGWKIKEALKPLEQGQQTLMVEITKLHSQIKPQPYWGGTGHPYTIPCTSTSQTQLADAVSTLRIEPSAPILDPYTTTATTIFDFRKPN